MDGTKPKGRLVELTKRSLVLVLPGLDEGTLRELAVHVLRSEERDFDIDDIDRICARAHGDARWLLTTLEFAYGKGGATGQSCVFEADRRRTDDIGAARKILYEADCIKDIEEALVEDEGYAVAALVQENYPLACGADVATASCVADCMVDDDIMETFVHATQSWEFLPAAYMAGMHRASSRLSRGRRAAGATLNRESSKPLPTPALRRRCRSRQAERRTGWGTVNPSSTWSKASYASAQRKKFCALVKTLRAETEVDTGVDMEWLTHFCAIVTEAAERADEGRTMEVVAAYAAGYGMRARHVEDIMRLCAPLTRTLRLKRTELMGLKKLRG